MPTPEERAIINKMKKSSQGAYREAKDAEPKIKGQFLPGGINNGVAQFSEYKLAEDKNGNPYVMLTGIVIKPAEHAGARATRGHFLMEPKSDQGKSLKEKYIDLFSDIQLLGVNTPDFDPMTALEQTFDTLKTLQKSKPCFKFSTWKKNEESDTIVFFQGVTDNPGTEEGDQDVSWEEEETEETEEETEEAPEEEEEEVEYEYEEEEEGEGEEEEETEDEGEEEEEYEEEEEEPSEDEEYEEAEEEEEEEEEWEPSVNDVYGFRVNSKAACSNCVVTAVSKTKQTVSLQRQKDKKEFKDISWSRLEDAE